MREQITLMALLFVTAGASPHAGVQTTGIEGRPPIIDMHLQAYSLADGSAPPERAVIGLFDPSARPHVPESTLTVAAPMARFERMVGNMEESFLITPTWEVIRKRIASSAG